MFRAVTINGSIQFPDGKSIGKRTDLLLEVNFIENGWEPIAKAATDERGILKGGGRVRGFEDMPVAPQFRLRAESERSPIATAYEVKLSSNGILNIDFGKIILGGADSGATDEECAELKKEVEDLSAQLEAAKDARTREVTRLEATVAERDRTILNLEEKLRTRENALDGVAATEIARLKSDLAGKQAELDRLSAEKDLKESDHAAAVQERDTLKSDLDLIRTSNTASPLITELAGSVAKSLGDASRTADGAAGFAVADAQVTLKGYLADGGQRFKPLDAAELSRTNAHAASEISFRLKPTEDQTNTGQQMPDVVGLTPASARRILRPLGNQIQLIEAAGKPAGGIVAQSPRAGQALPEGALIRLTVATGPAEES